MRQTTDAEKIAHRAAELDMTPQAYEELVPTLETFAQREGLDLVSDLKWPAALTRRAMHLDPDFEHLTYGDVGDARGSDMRHLGHDDLLVFYAGLRPTRPCEHKLIYAIVGLFVVDEVVAASDVSAAHRHTNAHPCKRRCGASDIVVRGRPGCSGRLARCLPIGEYRGGAYRVRQELLQTWGGLSVKGGYIQRSARPLRFLQPQRFMRWFEEQGVPLIQTNNPPVAPSPVVLVHLR